MHKQIQGCLLLHDRLRYAIDTCNSVPSQTVTKEAEVIIILIIRKLHSLRLTHDLHPVSGNAKFRRTMLARRAFAPYCGPLCRSNLSTSVCLWARHVPRQPAPKQADQPGGNSVAVTNTGEKAVGPVAEQWTEVVDQTSGGKYYWNQQTSEHST